MAELSPAQLQKLLRFLWSPVVVAAVAAVVAVVAQEVARVV